MSPLARAAVIPPGRSSTTDAATCSAPTAGCSRTTASASCTRTPAPASGRATRASAGTPTRSRAPPSTVAVGRVHDPPRRDVTAERLPARRARLAPRRHRRHAARLRAACPARSPSTASAATCSCTTPTSGTARPAPPTTATAAIRRHVRGGWYGGTQPRRRTTASTTSSRTPAADRAAAAARRASRRTRPARRFSMAAMIEYTNDRVDRDEHGRRPQAGCSSTSVIRLQHEVAEPLAGRPATRRAAHRSSASGAAIRSDANSAGSAVGHLHLAQRRDRARRRRPGTGRATPAASPAARASRSPASGRR